MVARLSLLALFQSAAALVASGVAAPGSTAIGRVALRNDLLRLLPEPGAPPVTLSGRTEELVRELELLESVPATSLFLNLGLDGAWTLSALQPSPDQLASANEPVQALPEVELLEVGSQFDASSSTCVATAKFRVAADDLLGSLELDAATSPSTERFDTITYSTKGRKLLIPRAPSSCDVPSMVSALHQQLPMEFLGDEDVRLGFQTTYLDELVRITRCTTRSLAGACAVHRRAPMDT